MPWLYSFAWSSAPLFTEKRFVLDGFLTSCTFDYINRDVYARVSQFCLIIGGFLTPFFLISIFYGFTLKELILKEKTKTDPKETVNLVNQVKQLKQHTFEENCKTFGLLSPKEDPNIMREHKLIKVIMIHLVIFCITWTPYSLMTLYAQFGNNIEEFITPYTISYPSLFAKASLIYGPIIFCLADCDAREYVLKRLFSCGTFKKQLK